MQAYLKICHQLYSSSTPLFFPYIVKDSPNLSFIKNDFNFYLRKEEMICSVFFRSSMEFNKRPTQVHISGSQAAEKLVYWIL